jgi:hypothetical protein
LVQQMQNLQLMNIIAVPSVTDTQTLVFVVTPLRWT